jgi:putative ABC transport system permease protein
VAAVVPLTGAAADPTLMPDFPGLADAASCREWDPGMPIDLDAIREQDEAYWEAHRGTPKAFVTLGCARRLWRNRFGAATAIRFERRDRDALASSLLGGLEPRDLGLVFSPVREAGRRAGTGGVDFGQLFLSLSFFIIVAALMLTGLLFALGSEQRSRETGILRALGFTAGTVQRLHLAEGLLLALIGAVIGTVLGIAYNQSVLELLATVWKGAVGTAAIEPQLQPLTMASGLLAGTCTAWLAMWLAVRRQVRRPVPALLGAVARASWRWRQPRPNGALAIAVVGVLGVAAILALVGPGRGREAAAAFWGAGFLMLATCLASLHALLCQRARRRGGRRPGLVGLGLDNAARKRRRSVTAAALLASGVFLVVAVAANRHRVDSGADQRTSGTGGFAFWGETGLPLQLDLDEAGNRRFFGLAPNTPGLDFVQLRRRAGDDASCLNLNRVGQPHILGVPTEELAARGAFSFVTLADRVDPASPWHALELDLGPAVVPAVADQTVIIWGLGMQLGDELTYVDERGQELKLRLVGGLANSIFQGHLLIDEDAFVAHFPSVSGARVLLVDAPTSGRDELADTLRRTMQGWGLELIPTAERLAAFTEVEHTYLSIFLALGGLGIILGTVGMGVIVLRDVLEQRGELALLRAIGFSRSELHRILLAEYLLVLVAGILCGVVSALVAVLPALLAPGAEIPFGAVGAALALILGSGVLWVVLATSLATRGDLLPALRQE